jgi:hypothetical protein
MANVIENYSKFELRAVVKFFAGRGSQSVSEIHPGENVRSKFNLN